VSHGLSRRAASSFGPAPEGGVRIPPKGPLTPALDLGDG
jgi:hypothetical protein